LLMGKSSREQGNVTAFAAFKPYGLGAVFLP